jgi:hypothetical protein
MLFVHLLLTSALPVVKVCLLALVGAALAHVVSSVFSDSYCCALTIYSQMPNGGTVRASFAVAAAAVMLRIITLFLQP